MLDARIDAETLARFSQEYKEANNSDTWTREGIEHLGYLLQYLKIGMKCSEVEALIGKARCDKIHGCLYDTNFRRVIDETNNITMPVFLVVTYQNENPTENDELLGFALIAIGE